MDKYFAQEVAYKNGYQAGKDENIEMATQFIKGICIAQKEDGNDVVIILKQIIENIEGNQNKK